MPFSAEPRGRRGAPRGGPNRPARGGGQAPALRRLVTLLTEASPDAVFVPGTRIREDRLPQLLAFLQRRVDAAPPARQPRLQRLLTRLTEPAPGEPFVHGVNVTRLEQLIAPPMAALPAAATTPEQLAAQIQQLSTQLQAAQQQLIALQTAAATPPPSASATPAVGKPAGEWFDDFI